MRNGKQFILTTPTKNIAEVSNIVALSYIGLMAYGDHHKPHHWGILTMQSLHSDH